MKKPVVSLGVFLCICRIVCAQHSAKPYLPSETDPYFPVGDARYEAAFIPNVQLGPIPSLWGHTAGAGGSPADEKFLNYKIGQFLAGH